MSEVKKAYDVKVLMAKWKGRGLDLAEDVAVMIIEETCDWVSESAITSKTPFDDVLVAVMPTLKKEAVKAADKIDGQEG